MSPRMQRTPFRRRVLALAIVTLGALGLASCATVRFNQKQRLAAPAMRFDVSGLAGQVESEVLSVREGAIGGFHGGGAGGCGCN